MIEPFIHSAHCEAWILCGECRTSRAFRASLLQQKAVPEIDFPCPYGFTENNLPGQPVTLPVLSVVNGTPIYDLPKIWGPRFWRELHTRAIECEGRDDSLWLATFAARIPCKECRAHWANAVQDAPPVWADYFRWTVTIHNHINRSLKKPELSPESAARIWAARDALG